MTKMTSNLKITNFFQKSLNSEEKNNFLGRTVVLTALYILAKQKKLACNFENGTIGEIYFLKT